MATIAARVGAFALIGCAALVASGVQAQDVHDSRPLRIIVITPPGGQADTTARLLSDGLAKALKRPVIIENRAGAGGNIATEWVAQQPPDGTTLLLTSNNHTINPTLFKNVNYDYQKSFEPVMQLTSGPSVIVANPASGIRTVADILARAKQGPLSYGSTGTGSGPHMAFEIFKAHTGADIAHVPYKGAGPAVIDVLGGQVPFVSVSLTSSIGYIKSGKLIGVAVSSAKRWPDLPDVPTLEESGCTGCAYETWIALFAPKGTSKVWVDEVNRQVTAVMADPEIRARLAGLGTAPATGSPADLAAMIKRDYDVTSAIIKRTGMTTD